MKKKSPRRRALTIATGMALSTFALSAGAEPFTLEATCALSTTVPGQQVTCQLTFFVSDDFLNATTIRKGQIRVNGIVVAQYNNDNLNPSEVSVGTSGTTIVACGATHNVQAFIAPATPSNSAYERVGSNPPITCPSAVNPN